MARIPIVIMGAAGRDFHDFQTVFRDDPSFEVIAFTATQIPGIDDRVYPSELAGPLYPGGIPIRPESDLADLIADHGVREVVFSYSDLSHAEVMHKASLALAHDADFRLLGAGRTMLDSKRPIISVCAVRTGVGKSGISRRIYGALRDAGLRVVDVRHPMPYRDLGRMRVERYASIDDLDRLGVTIEEREEYEPLVAMGAVVMAGVDYEAVLAAAEDEADVIIWDGGNNDLPFFRSDLEIVALDPHRPGHERLYHPGEANFLRADVLVINKVNTAACGDVEGLIAAAARHNPDATVVITASGISVSADPSFIRGKRVLAIEDGPTVTHGGMAYGAATLAARKHGAGEIVDPRPFAVGSVAVALREYPHLESALPAVGYSAAQLADLEASIAAVPCDMVIVGTPVDLSRVISIEHEVVRATYEVEDAGSPTLDDIVAEFIATHGLNSRAVPADTTE